MLLDASGGSSYSFSTPVRPAASIAANARYGLHAGSGERNSMRVADSLPGLYIGTRTSALRLRRAQQMYTGASYPGTKRLYEFTHWFVTRVISRACLKMPAMYPRATFERWYSSVASKNALRSPSNSDWCVCMPLPFTPNTGLGMKVAYTPNSWAASFTVNRYVMTQSAMLSASAYLRSISCWDGAT